MARLAEDVGFDSVWVGDHLLYRDPRGLRGPWEAWTQLAALAETTQRVLIGPLVATTAFHSPPMLAKLAATVDEISGGRLILGLGAGWNRVEFDAFGFPYDHRASRFEEAFDVVRRLLAGEAVDHDGRWYRLQGCVLHPPPRPGGPRLMVGSAGPRVLRATLPWVDVWNAWYSWYGNTPEGFARLSADVDDLCGELALDPAGVTRTAAVLVALPDAVGRPQREGGSESTPVTGDPGSIATTLRRFAEAGAEHVQLVIDPITEASIEAMGEVLALLDAG